MNDVLLKGGQLDEDGRKILLSDSVHDVFYYDASAESWDKEGNSEQSWFNELFKVDDSFFEISKDKWGKVLTAGGESSLSASEYKLNAHVERSEGNVGLSSDGKWVLTGDFELRLYIDWSSYYNEYRANSHLYLKAAVDNSNAVRLSFSFVGSSFQFDSEKTVGRDLQFFDWRDNGAAEEVPSFEEANNYQYLKIIRASGEIKCYISDGETDVQVGNTIDDPVFSGDMYVGLGVECKEFNTLRASFDNFFASGTVSPTQKFFSTVRGERQSFPDRTILTVDNESVSIIDADTYKLWMRLLFNSSNNIETSSKVTACNGTVYLTTDTGLLALDFQRDKIFKYRGDKVLKSLEPISLRNGALNFVKYVDTLSSVDTESVKHVHCRLLGSQDYVAFTTPSGVFVGPTLSSGISFCSDGLDPQSIVSISDNGALYWSGFDSSENKGELSYHSNITTFSGGTFSRSGFYSDDIVGEDITALHVLTTKGRDIFAVGTTEGISFFGFSPATPGDVKYTFGAETETNPVQDPYFLKYLSEDWKIVQKGLQQHFVARKSDEFSTHGDESVKLGFDKGDGTLASGTLIGVEQVVDLTGVTYLYFDAKLERDVSKNPSVNAWNAEFVVGESVLKSYQDLDGPFEKQGDVLDVSSFTGEHKLSVRVRVPNDLDASYVEGRFFYVDNFRTIISESDYPILPPKQASITDVFLQYDPSGHKIYFSSPGGNGVVDLDDKSFDYFDFLESQVPDSDVFSSDFQRT